MARPDKKTRGILQALEQLETLIQVTNNEFEMYFMGVLRRAPEEKHREIKRLLHEFSEMHLTNTRVLFKLRVLRTRMNSLSLRWLRTMKQIEDGTYRKHRWLADKRDAERAKQPKSKSSDEVRAEIRALMRGEDPEAAAATVSRERGDPPDVASTVRTEGRKVTPPRGADANGSSAAGHEIGSDGLSDAYVRARQGSGNNDSVNRAALEATLNKHREQIKAKYGVRDVRFKVITENGKPKVKAVPVK